MIKKYSKNTGRFIAFSLFVAFVYGVLVRDTYWHISISSFIEASHHIAQRHHVLIAGLLPVYVGLMIFGGAILAWHVISPTVQSILIKMSDK